jgi:hypothetical protein
MYLTLKEVFGDDLVCYTLILDSLKVILLLFCNCVARSTKKTKILT